MVTDLEQRSRKKNSVVPLRQGPAFKGIQRVRGRYWQKARRIYDGPAGGLLSLTSVLSLREPLIGWLLRKGELEVRDARTILDVGCGSGQVLGHLVRWAPNDASLVGSDLSESMLLRARRRLKTDRPRYLAADVSHLPFADGSFDCITCGWVLEYLPDPRAALAELVRVLRPGGRVLVMATEDSLWGALVGLFWRCRTYSREELHLACEQVGLTWHREIWFTRIHKMFRLGGIFVEAVKRNGQP